MSGSKRTRSDERHSESEIGMPIVQMEQPDGDQLIHQNQGFDNSGSNNTIKRTRGPTMCKDVWSQSEGRCVYIDVNNEGQPVGDNASKLSTFLGTLARNGAYAPVNYEDWRLMPNEYKQDMWKMVEAKFEMDPVAKDWTMMSLAKKWKDFKAKVKDKWFNKKERDHRVLSDQFEWLLKFWETTKAKKREVVGKRNRLNLKSVHTSGTKSFARKRHEMKATGPKGSNPSRADVYIATHTRKDGKPVDTESAIQIEKLQQVAETQGLEFIDICGPNDIFSKVMGEDKGNYVRTFGLGPSPKDLWGHKETRLTLRKVASHAQKSAEEKIEHVYNKLDNLIARVDKMTEVLQTRCPDVNLDDLFGLPSQGKSTCNLTGSSSAQENHPLNQCNEGHRDQPEHNLDFCQMSTRGSDPVNDVLHSLLPTLRSSTLGHRSETIEGQSRVVDRIGCDLLNEVDDRTASLIQILLPQLGALKSKNQQTQPRELQNSLGSMTMSEYDCVTIALKSIRDPAIHVAKGIVVSKNPDMTVGGQELGPGFYEVHIEIAVVKDEPLIRPYGSYKTIGDVVGRVVAWPSCLVVESTA